MTTDKMIKKIVNLCKDNYADIANDWISDVLLEMVNERRFSDLDVFLRKLPKDIGNDCWRSVLETIKDCLEQDAIYIPYFRSFFAN